MGNLKILDCTLRDGGYINNWRFGENGIKRIISNLSQANIEIIECGFLTNKGGKKGTTLFDDITKINDYLINKDINTMYVAMIAYPNDIVKDIPSNNGDYIDGIRVTFHENEINEALRICEELVYKGYQVFVQPVGLTSYEDYIILDLIKKVNEIKPFAFYIVDTLGSMYKNNLLRLYYLIDNNLDEDISIGFHSHNNLQLSFSNAQELISMQTRRNIIIDASVFGMGRGAGNLCTELIANYINTNIEEKYNIEDLLEIMDEHLNNFYLESPWGYSAPYCLAATKSCHPNYAKYLLEKQTLSVKSISDILKDLDYSKRTIFYENYIEEMYIEYQKKYVDDKEELENLRKSIDGKEVLIIAPGSSLAQNINLINDIINTKNVIVFNINFFSQKIKSDYVFISNNKRFEELSESANVSVNYNVILTSNITNEVNALYSIINYSDLLIDNPVISDNAGLMLINLLRKLNVKKIYLAGFDGYSEIENNYIDTGLELAKTKQNIIKMNKAIGEAIHKLRLSIDITFITESKYN